MKFYTRIWYRDDQGRRNTQSSAKWWATPLVWLRIIKGPTIWWTWKHIQQVGRGY